jgi:hypothetical protein
MSTQLVTRASSWIDDWYVIEYADGGSISDACVEGTKGEIIALAQAVLAGGEEYFRRCSVSPTDDGFVFSSPRNSEYSGDEIPRDVAVAWATATLEQFASGA